MTAADLDDAIHEIKSLSKILLIFNSKFKTKYWFHLTSICKPVYVKLTFFLLKAESIWESLESNMKSEHSQPFGVHSTQKRTSWEISNFLFTILLGLCSWFQILSFRVLNFHTGCLAKPDQFDREMTKISYYLSIHLIVFHYAISFWNYGEMERFFSQVEN